MSPDYVPDFSAYVLPYVKWFQDDFVGGVRGMRAHEIGIYTMLLMEMYARGKALDMSDDRLARLCGSEKRTFTKALELLIDEGKIIRLKCGLWNERCENAFRERAKMQQQQKLAGEASAEKRRKNKGEIERTFNERSTDEQPISEAQIEEAQKERKEERGGADAPADMAFVGRVIRLNLSDFDRWRKAYPAVADMSAELTKADDYFVEYPPKDGKWFFPTSKWLDRANKDALKANGPSEAEIYPPGIYGSLR